MRTTLVTHFHCVFLFPVIVQPIKLVSLNVAEKFETCRCWKGTVLVIEEFMYWVGCMMRYENKYYKRARNNCFRSQFRPEVVQYAVCCSPVQGCILVGNGAVLPEPGEEPLFPIADKKQYKTMLALPEAGRSHPICCNFQLLAPAYWITVRRMNQKFRTLFFFGLL